MPKRTANLSNEEKIEKLTSLVEDIDENKEPFAEEKRRFKNLKDLVLLGRLERVVEFPGYSFRVSTLSNFEQNKILKTLMKEDEENRLLYAKASTLSYAIKDINGIPIDELCEDEEDADNARLMFIMNLQSSVLEKLFVAYEELTKESLANTGVEDLKK
jgi:hypothetical protein